ncbi:MAG: hypothetical protein K2M07_05215 [Muribaculaceae bacterium]|nr:hypothetical protein [Muribaculaceae bacterium]
MENEELTLNESTQPIPESQPSDFPTPTSLDLAALESMLAEAEQRGYDRARSEIATAAMDSPVLGEQPEPKPEEVVTEPFLANRRRSVWD